MEQGKISENEVALEKKINSFTAVRISIRKSGRLFLIARCRQMWYDS